MHSVDYYFIHSKILKYKQGQGLKPHTVSISNQSETDMAVRCVFMMRVLEKLGTVGTYHRTIKAAANKPVATTTLNGEKQHFRPNPQPQAALAGLPQFRFNWSSDM